MSRFSPHTANTPTDNLDLRCEYDVPRYTDLLMLTDHQNPFSGFPLFTGVTLKREQGKTRDEETEQQNFIWFNSERDYTIPKSQNLEEAVRTKILHFGTNK